MNLCEEKEMFNGTTNVLRWLSLSFNRISGGFLYTSSALEVSPTIHYGLAVLTRFELVTRA